MADRGSRGSGDAEQLLYGLMNVAQEQQAAAAEALAALVTEREALARERAGLAKQAEAMQAQAAALRRAVGDLGPALAARTELATEQAVVRSLGYAGVTATAAVEAAVRPVLGRLDRVMAQASEAEASLRRIVGWTSWRLLGRGLAVVAVLAVLLWGAHLSVWWWAERDVAVAQAQKALLLAEIAGLQDRRDELAASRDALAKSGALAKVTRCEPGGRLCIRVNEEAGPYGSPPDYRVILGY